MTNLDSILKSRDITFLTKVHLFKAMVFPVVMYGCESWTIKKVEHWRIDAFELWCRRWLLRVPWTARRLNQSILKEISPKYSLEGLKLKFQYFGRLMWRTDSNEKAPMLGLWRQEENEKAGLKLNIQKTKIMLSDPITSWEIDGETVETVSDFIFGGSKITAMVTTAMKLKDPYSLEGKLWPT